MPAHIDRTAIAIEAQRRALESLGISRREERLYSIGRALAALAEGASLSGFEGEVDAEMRRKHTARSSHSLLIPTNMRLSGTRDMTVASAANGGHLVATNLLAGNFIEMLRERLVFGRLGATMLSGLVGNVAIPKQSAGATAHWLTNEATAITESEQTLTQVTLAPKNVGALTEFSRQLIMQATPDVDQMIMNDLAAVLADAIDAAIIGGTGLNGQPAGLRLLSGMGSFSSASCGYSNLLEAVADLGGSNALNPNCAFVTTTGNAAKLMQRTKIASTYSPLWEEGNITQGRVASFRAVGTNRVAANELIFADFAQLVIGEWGSLELAVNPFQNFASGLVAIRALKSVDFAWRHSGAISYSNDFS